MSLPKTQKVIFGNKTGQPNLEEIEVPVPSQNQVLVKIHYAPINPCDLAQLRGIYGDPKNIGHEGSGVIVAVGENLKVSHKVGDRVHVNGPGTYAQYLATESENCFPILLEDLSFEEAASHFINPITVYCMGHLAEKEGHKAAICTVGASALGKMFIKYFKLKGMKVISIVRRDEYIEDLKKEGADYVLNQTASDFEAQLTEIAEKEKATISFDFISGEFPAKVLKCQPPGSICYVSGGLDGGADITKISFFVLCKNKRVGALEYITYLNALSEEERKKAYKETHSLLSTAFTTHVEKTYPPEQAKEAIEWYLQNRSKGRVLLKFN